MNVLHTQEHPSEPSPVAAWARRAATVGAVLGLGLSAALGAFAAPQANSPGAGNPQPYSWPGFHAGGTTDPTAVAAGAPVPYRQLQGTPSGLFVNGGNSYATQIPSQILGNYNPGQPPTGLTGAPPNVAYFPNHFADGPLFSPHYRQLTGPLGFLAPPPGSGTANVVSSPTAVNVSEYPDIATMHYYGEQALNTTGATSGAPDPTRRGGVGATGVQAVRQVVYYGRTEAVTALSDGNGGVTVGGVAVPATANIPVGSVINVGAIYAMDGFTGAVIWRYQVPSFSATSAVTAANQFRANLTGTAQFNVGTSPAPFQIGPAANAASASPEGSAALDGTAGTFHVTNAPPTGLPVTTPANTLNFSLYATNATTTSTVVTTGGTATTVTATNYTGTFRIFLGISATGTEANDGNILEHGTFTMTVDVNGNVTAGQFTADVGDLQPAYATGPVDFGFLTPALIGAGSTFNSTTGALNLNLVAPLGGTLQDASPFTSVSVARINVATGVGGTVASKLVVIAADNNGFVYCLDALGNSDGSSNTNVEVIGSSPVQVAYTAGDGTVLGTPATGTEAHAHVGTTNAFWVYRPDPAQPHLASGATDTAPSVNHDLPVPLAFNTASPTVYVDPTVTNGTSPNATVYIGNSNGVLYALDATGGVDPAAAAFNRARTGLTGVADTTPTCNPRWWYAVSGTNADTGNNTTAIESAPAVYAPVPAPVITGGGPTAGGGGTAGPTVYFGTSDSTGGNVGRLYAVDGLNGPTGPGGAAITPGTLAYNVNQQGAWTFPSSFATAAVPAPAIRKPLGDVSGSPVVFLADGVNPVIYFAANTGDEFLNGAVVPGSADNGRLWGVKPDGTYAFSYPSAGDPNAAPAAASSGDFAPANNTPPMEGFLHATPAIGFVQFPALTQNEDTAGGAATSTGLPAPSASVPMLYIGTTGAGGYFYGVNIDPAATTPDVIRVVAPEGASFVSSPALVTNPSTAGGNGGAVFLCTSQGQLLQYQATPTSTASASANYPSPRLDYTFPVGGPISAPAVAAANVSDVVSAPGLVRTETVTDWVYVGDSNSGQCWGFTPRGFGTDTTGQYLNGFLPVTPDNLNLPPVIPQFPLRAFLFDDPQKNLAAGTAASPKSTTMDNAFSYGIYGNPHSPLPAFEWGQSVSVRIANVVPPGAPDPGQNPGQNNFIPITADDGTGTGNTTTYYLGNGGPVTFQVADVSVAAGTNTTNTTAGITLSIPNIVLPGATPDPSQQNGFFRRTDAGSRPVNFGPSSELDGSGAPRATQTQLLDLTGKGWVAAGTYSIGASTQQDALGQQHPNTPGSRRQIINAAQTYTLYQSSDNGATAAGFTPVVQKNTAGAFVTNNANQNKLTLSANPAFNYSLNGGSYPGATGNGSGTIVIDQPTFGILNPLAVRGAGIDLTAPTLQSEAAQTWVDSSNAEGVGPFGPVPTLFNTSVPQTVMAALANGNNVLTNPPASGVLGDNANPTQGTGTLRSFATNYAPYFRYVITTTGQVVHGTTGDNSDPAPVALPNFSTTDLQGKNATTYGYGPYLLNVADRSALGLSGGALNVTAQNRALTWNDNSVNFAANGGSGGPAARINPLPWDDLPLTQQNSSRDYPDIPGRAVTFNLPATLPGASVPAAGGLRQIVPTPVQVSVSVPKYQPANLQLWARPKTSTAAPFPVAPNQSGINSIGNYNFPMGYVSRQRITGTTGTTSVPNFRNRGNPNEGAAFRVVYVYTGVPADMSTSIQNTVTDIGAVPHGFGIQMDNYAPPATGTAIGPFSPYNLYPGFAGHFLPLTIRNNGNTNLLNPHLDQKYQLTAANSPLSSLPLLSDALNTDSSSPLSTIPAFDFNNISGNNTNGVNGFLVRSSLDTDLSANYGVNPGIAVQGLRPQYPVATFHKPRVGDTQGTTMTVPDVPHDNIPGFPYALTLSQQQLTVNNASQVVLPGTNTLAATLPYVSVAVPLGTPVGNYSTPLHLFEGFDPNYSPLVGPTYTPINGSPNDILAVAPATTNTPAHGVQPTSRPGTQLVVHVNEDRATDGLTPGALPQIDVAPQPNLTTAGGAATGTADFAPAAYRDPASGSLSLFWTSARLYNPTANPPTPPYSVFGTSLPFNNGGNTPYYTNAVGHFTPAAGSQWWTPLTSPITNNTVTGVDFNVAVDQIINGGASAHPAYGFVTTITGSGTTTQYAINCAPLTNPIPRNTPPTLGTSVPVASSTQPKSGVHGLAFTLPGGFQDPSITATSAISNNLWAFWTGGTRGRTALYYGSTTTNSSGAPGTFTTPATLPIPAGLVSVADANATLVQAPDTITGNTIPAIEVTYSGVSATGNSDIYVSRYRPYTATPAGAPTGTAPSVLLGLMRMPVVTELLQGDPRSQWYQARDVGWARNGILRLLLTTNILTGGTTSRQPTQLNYIVNTANGVSTVQESEIINGQLVTPAPPARPVVFDRASGVLVLTNVDLPTATGGTIAGQNIFLDLASGRVRFSTPLPSSGFGGTTGNTVGTSVSATFDPTARRVTTSPAADTAPVSFLDDAYMAPTTPGNANVQASRYWFLWHKDAVGKTNPSLWYKTQRLTFALTTPYMDRNSGDTVNQPYSIPPGSNVRVTVGSSNTLVYQSGGAGNVADLDAARGRVYFPTTIGNPAVATEGQNVTVTVTVPGGQPVPYPGYIYWLDEPRLNDPNNQSVATVNQLGVLGAAADDGALVPISNIANESGVTAFLDPAAYANGAASTALTPHNVWVFWTSTRNGTGDIFYETINPRFAPTSP